jgi:hypothetical protein
MKLRILKRWPFGDRILRAGSTIQTVGPDDRGVTEREAKKLIEMGIAEEVT